MGGLGVSSASLLALATFLASAVGASDFLPTIFSETFVEVSFTKTVHVEKCAWLLLNEQESLFDEPRKIGLTLSTSNCPRFNVYEIFNAHQSKFVSQWLKVVRGKN